MTPQRTREEILGWKKIDIVIKTEKMELTVSRYLTHEEAKLEVLMDIRDILQELNNKS